MRLRPGMGIPRAWERVVDTRLLTSATHNCHDRLGKTGDIVHKFKQGDEIGIATHAGGDWAILATPESLRGCWVRLRSGGTEPRCWERVVDAPCVDPPLTNEVVEMVERVEPWVQACVPYSQQKWRNGYRTDCSGMLAKFWGMKENEGLTTRHFFKNSFAGADAILDRDPRYTRNRAKFDGVRLTDLISFEELQPGDGLYKACPPGGSCGHVMMVVGSADGGALQIYHQAGRGAGRDTLTRIGGQGENAASGYTLSLARGAKTLWTAKVWAIRKRDGAGHVAKAAQAAAAAAPPSAGGDDDGDEGGEGDEGDKSGLVELSRQLSSCETNEAALEVSS